MVNFAEALEDERIQEWRDYYVNYNRLKGWIAELETSMAAEAAMSFFDELTLAFERVESFYGLKEDALRDRLIELPQLTEIERVKCVASIEQDIDKLNKFAEMNREGLRKICKKFDKVGVRNQSGGADKGKNQSNQEVDWGSSTESLQKRLVERFQNYKFGQATERLESIRASIHEWKSGAKKYLEAPLLPSSASAKGLNGELSRGLVPRMKSKWRQRYGYTLLYMISIAALVLGVWAKNCLPFTGLFATSCATDPLNTQSYLVIWVTLMTLTLLVWQWPSDSVMICATLFLNICGCLNSVEAWGAFANSVVLSVASLSAVGDCVSHTGIVDILFAKILGDTKNLYMAQFKILIPCALGAASISNTCVMACSMPAVEDWCNKNGYHMALFFLPISYLMLVSGTFAVFSTSTNLVAQGLLVAHELPPLSTFELGYPALINSCVSLVYLMLATPFFLNRFLKSSAPEKVSDPESQTVSKVLPGARAFFVRVRMQLRLQQTKTIQESGILECLSPGVACIDSVERHGQVQEQPASEFALNFDDILSLRVSAGAIQTLRSLAGFQLLSQDNSELYATMHLDTRELVEVVLDEGSPLVGHRLGKAKTFSVYAGAVVGLRLGAKHWASKSGSGKERSQSDVSGRGRSPSPSPNKFNSPGADPNSGAMANATGIPQVDGSEWLSHGDQVVLDVPAGFADQWRESADFVMLKKLVSKNVVKDQYKAYVSGAILFVMLVFVALSLLDLFVCAMSAIVLLCVTKCSTVASVKKAVPLKVVLTIVGAFGLGTAIGKHGIASQLAKLLVGIFSPWGHTGLLVAIWIVVVMLGVIFHGTAVVALMFPLCHHVAIESGIPLHQMVAVLCYSVACQMLSPVSYNTNLMAYAACPDYKFSDFPKVGAPLVVILAVISIPMAQTVFHAQPWDLPPIGPVF